MAAVPGCLGDIGIVVGPAGPLARSALYRDIEGGPPLAIVRRGAIVTQPDLAGGEILEAAVAMEGGQRARQVLAILGPQGAARAVGKLLVPDGASDTY